MTSSLVGSEMCIRDSLRGVGKAPAQPWSRDRLVCLGGRGQLGRGVGSVSYTHLTLPTICSV
eukprot:7690646-Prorocentrum_lima.AAC.1